MRNKSTTDFIKIYQKASIFNRLINIIATRPLGQGFGIFRAKKFLLLKYDLNYLYNSKIVC
jgi:hypothetical protein